MIPPTQANLKALAGWAISQVHRASPAQEVALHKFKDGCAALIEDPLPVPSTASSPSVKTATPVRRVAQSPARTAKVNIQRDQMPVVAQLSCQDGGDHRFDIKTQCCVWCGGTYRQLKSRSPEFMK